MQLAKVLVVGECLPRTVVVPPAAGELVFNPAKASDVLAAWATTPVDSAAVLQACGLESVWDLSPDVDLAAAASPAAMLLTPSSTAPLQYSVCRGAVVNATTFPLVAVLASAAAAPTPAAAEAWAVALLGDDISFSFVEPEAGVTLARSAQYGSIRAVYMCVLTLQISQIPSTSGYRVSRVVLQGVLLNPICALKCN